MHVAPTEGKSRDVAGPVMDMLFPAGAPSKIPIAGSAYTYAYASFGELFAWIIGWALIMEYSIGNIYVAFS